MNKRFIICRASAGSGKTYALVRQYIETAISSPSQLEHRFEHILAITFTNKAANGMKERLMSQIHSIVEGEAKSDALCAEIAKDLGIDSDEVRRRCAVLQSAVLHHYSELAVCTIDSFVHRLVRTFAHDLKLPLNFDVMIDNQQIVQSSVDELLSLAGTEGQQALTKVLCAYTESRMDEGKSYNLDSQLAKLAKEIFKEEAPKYLSELDKVALEDYIDIQKRLVSECRQFEEKLKEVSKELVDAVAAVGLTINDFPYNKSGALGLFYRLADGDYSKINDSHSRADDAYSKQQLWATKTPQNVRDTMAGIMPAYNKAYEDVMSLLENDLVDYNSRQLLLSNIFGLALLSSLNQIKNTYYKDNEIVHISEFNKRIAEEVMNEPTPFIYERIGSRYFNYMIDEFQDTSRLQWLNFLPLLDEAMTHSFPSDTAEPGLQSLVVGDGKQAIYRFRQGDVRQFMRLPEVDSPLHGHSLAHNAEVVALRKNYRTKRNIVEFNNRFFESIIRNEFAHNPELTKLYLGDGHGSPLRPAKGIDEGADLIQEPVKEGGYVQVSFTEKEDIFDSILATIHQQVDELGYRYGDIMILARDNDILVKISDIISASESPVPLVSSESFLLSGSREVLLMQSLLAYIYNPRDRVAALQVLRFLGYDDKEWQLRDAGFDLAPVLEDLIHQDDERRPFDVEWLRTLSLYDLCETLIRLFDLDGRDNRALASFMNVVNNYAQKGRADLGDFVKYLDEKLEKLSSTTAADLDAVQLMTIHKAKGLEAKVVLYAMPAKRAPNEKMWVDVSDRDAMGLPVAFVGIQKKKPSLFSPFFEEEERMMEMDRVNVLYVAMTRAEEKLFVFCEDAKATGNTDNISLLRGFVNADQLVVRQGDENVFSVGEDSMCEAAERQEKLNTLKVSSILFPEWESRVSIAQQSAGILSPLDADSRRYGILIHDLLSQIRVADDVEPVVERYSKENNLPDAVGEVIRGRIEAMLADEENRRLFDGRYKIKCEASIAANGKVRRPDRILFGEDETIVVDFKTGVRDERSHAKYQQQVDEYASLLTEMGFPNVSSVIIYL